VNVNEKVTMNCLLNELSRQYNAEKQWVLQKRNSVRE
jgi:hypothetical protein